MDCWYCSCSVLHKSQRRKYAEKMLVELLTMQKEARRKQGIIFLSQVCNLKQDTLKGSLSDLNVMFGMPRNQKGKPLHE